MTYKVFWSNEDKAYIATVDKYPSMSGIGDTKEEAIKELKIAMEGINENN